MVILAGTWNGKEADGSSAGQVVFGDHQQVKFICEEMAIRGTFAIDFSVTPNVLTFTLDGPSHAKAYALIKIKESGELCMTHLSDTPFSDWSKQDVVTLQPAK